MTALSINESLFYIPFDHTGVISVCNNKYGHYCPKKFSQT